jgi:glycosyltransferase involved in cell wall biosynthesis
VRALVLSRLYSDPSQRQKLRELAGLGWSITVAIPGGVADMDGAIRLSPIPVSGSTADPDRLRWSGRAFRKLLTDARPEIVHTEEAPGTPGAWTAVREATRFDVPAVIFSWESLPRERGWLERRRLTNTMSRVAGVIGGNRLALRLLQAEAPKALAISLPQTGITPPSAVDPRPRDMLAMAYVGRLVPERGVDRLLHACGQLMGPWRLFIAGTGPEQPGLEDLAEKLGLASRIRWLGPQSRAEVTALWSQINCLVLPSRSTSDWLERYSRPLLDAMAHEVATVVAAESALPELVGDAGIAVQSDEELLVALQELLVAPERRAALGHAGRRRVLERYVDAAIARETDAFWRQVTARHPRPSRPGDAQ